MNAALSLSERTKRRSLSAGPVAATEDEPLRPCRCRRGGVSGDDRRLAGVGVQVGPAAAGRLRGGAAGGGRADAASVAENGTDDGGDETRSEEHTSELQSRENLVCR